MEWQSKLRWLLVVAHVSAAVALAAARIERHPLFLETVYSASMSLVTCQFYLATAWGVLRRTAWWRRAAIVVAPFPVALLPPDHMPEQIVRFLAFLLPLSATAAFLAGIARFIWSYRFCEAENCKPSYSVAVPSASRQYSLRSLMIWMSIAAVVCAAFRMLVAPWLDQGNVMWPFLAATISTNAVLLHVWFREDRLAMKRTVAFLLVLATATMLRGIADIRPTPINAMTSLYECTFAAATLQTLRVSGIRLVRQLSNDTRKNIAVIPSDENGPRRHDGTTSTLPN